MDYLLLIDIFGKLKHNIGSSSSKVKGYETSFDGILNIWLCQISTIIHNNLCLPINYHPTLIIRINKK